MTKLQEIADDLRNSAGQEIVVAFLELMGEDTQREGLLETPERVVKAWNHWFGGYYKKASDTLTTFKDGGERYDQMIVVKDIPFYSHCEHHLAPFFGTATVGYIPNEKIVGLSKLSRLVDIFARRLQVQERLTAQVADSLMDALAPIGAACHIKARHLCMESRGIQQQGHCTITNVLRGAFLKDPTARAEFLDMTK